MDIFGSEFTVLNTDAKLRVVRDLATGRVWFKVESTAGIKFDVGMDAKAHQADRIKIRTDDVDERWKLVKGSWEIMGEKES